MAQFITIPVEILGFFICMKIRIKKLGHKNDTLKSFIRRNAFHGTTLKSVGWWNGYVSIPKEHPCYEKDYGDIHNMYDIDVHGGLTYSNKEGNRWVIGFDTGHIGDTSEYWTEEKVKEEADRLKDQLKKLW